MKITTKYLASLSIGYYTVYCDGKLSEMCEKISKNKWMVLGCTWQFSNAHLAKDNKDNDIEFVKINIPTLINKPVETTNEYPENSEIISKAKIILDNLDYEWGMCPDIKIEKKDILEEIRNELQG